jgi:hypothetical protein
MRSGNSSPLSTTSRRSLGGGGRTEEEGWRWGSIASREPERYAEMKMAALSGTGLRRDFEAGFFYGLVMRTQTTRSTHDRASGGQDVRVDPAKFWDIPTASQGHPGDDRALDRGCQPEFVWPGVQILFPDRLLAPSKGACDLASCRACGK